MDIMENKDFLSESDEFLVKGFFDDNKIDIADNGFSERVMRRLPSPAIRLSRIWTAVCTLLGVAWLVSVLSGITMAEVKGSVLYSCRSFAEGIFSQIISLEVSRHSLLMCGVAFLSISFMFAYNLLESKGKY